MKIDRAALMGPIGRSGLNRWGGHVFEEFHRNLAGSKAAKVYREMESNDPIVGSILFAVTSLMRQVAWRVEPADPTRPSALAAAELLEEELAQLETPWDDVISEALTMIPYGWAYLETIYRVRPDGRFGWRAFEGRSQDTLDEWAFDRMTGKCLGWWQLSPPDFQRVFLPLDKGIHFRTRKNKDNPEGRSMLRSAYRPWFFKKRIEEVEGIGIERDMAGLPVMEVPAEIMAPNANAENTALRALAESIVKGVRMDERMGLVLPASVDSEGKPTGWKFSLLTSGGRRAVDTNVTITRYDQRIAMTMLAQFILLGMDKVGSFALAESATGMFAVALGSILNTMEEAIHTQGTRELMRLNGVADEDVPRIVHGDIEKQDLGKLATALKDLVAAGAFTPDGKTEDILRELADLPPHDPETAKPAQADMVPPRTNQLPDLEADDVDEEEPDDAPDPKA